MRPLNSRCRNLASLTCIAACLISIAKVRILRNITKKKQPLTIWIDVNQSECVPRFRPKHGEGDTLLAVTDCKCCR